MTTMFVSVDPHVSEAFQLQQERLLSTLSIIGTTSHVHSPELLLSPTRTQFKLEDSIKRLYPVAIKTTNPETRAGSQKTHVNRLRTTLPTARPGHVLPATSFVLKIEPPTIPQTFTEPLLKTPDSGSPRSTLFQQRLSRLNACFQSRKEPNDHRQPMPSLVSHVDYGFYPSNTSSIPACLPNSPLLEVNINYGLTFIPNRCHEDDLSRPRVNQQHELLVVKKESAKRARTESQDTPSRIDERTIVWSAEVWHKSRRMQQMEFDADGRPLLGQIKYLNLHALSKRNGPNLEDVAATDRFRIIGISPRNYRAMMSFEKVQDDPNLPQKKLDVIMAHSEHAKCLGNVPFPIR